jgi:hypothetical protein
MNKEGVYIQAERGRKMNLKNRERGRRKKKEKWGGGGTKILQK